MAQQNQQPERGMKHSVLDVAVVVSDAQAALAFYRDTLGLENFADTLLPDGGTVHRFRLGESQVKIIEYAEGRSSDPLLGAMDQLGVRYLTFYVADLDERVEAARKAGYAILVEPTEVRPNFRVAMLDDPDGNRVELIETPAG